MKVTEEQERYLARKAGGGDQNAAESLSGRTLPEDVLIWNAFMALRSSAPSGMGFTPISITEILSYCELRGLHDPDVRETIRSGVMAMDQVLKEHYGTS